MTPTNPIKRAWRIASAILLVAVTAAALSIVVPSLFGYERYVITGGSMTGSIDRGSVLFEKPVPVSELRRGDVITYEPPAGSGAAGNVTHRIHAMRSNSRGRLVLRTKGDANRAPDPWTFTLDRATQPRAEFHLPHVGFVLMALQDRTARMLLIGLPAILVALSVLAGLWREAGTEARREGGGTEVAA